MWKLTTFVALAFVLATVAMASEQLAPQPGVGSSGAVTPGSKPNDVPTNTKLVHRSSKHHKRQVPASAADKKGPASAQMAQPPVVPKGGPDAPKEAAAQRNLLALQGGPADAFNKATHAHKRTKESAAPSKAGPAANSGNEAGAAKRPAQPQDAHAKLVPRTPTAKPQEAGQATLKTQPASEPSSGSYKESAAKKPRPQSTTVPTPSAATPTNPNGQRNLLSVHNGPADAFNKAAHAHKRSKETAPPSKVDGAAATKGNEAGAAKRPSHATSAAAAPTKTTTKPQEAGQVALKKKPATTAGPAAAPAPAKDASAGGRNLLQWGGGWSGSQAQAQAQAQAMGGGFGGWGGSQAQAQAQAQSQSWSGGYGGRGRHGWGYGRKLMSVQLAATELEA